MMSRTNEVSFWTSKLRVINLWALGKLFTVGNHTGCLPLCLGSRTAQYHWQDGFVAAWKMWVKISALCYQVNNLNSSQTSNDRSSTDCQGLWHALVSHLKVNSSAWFSDFKRGVGLAATITPQVVYLRQLETKVCCRDYIPFVKGFNLVLNYTNENIKSTWTLMHRIFDKWRTNQ